MTTSTYESEAATLRALIDAGLVLHLAANAPALSRATAAADFEEVSFPGYTPVPLPPHVWSVERGKPGEPTAAYAPMQTFQRTQAGAPVDVYCWYLTTAAGLLVDAGLLPDGPWDVRRASDAIQLRPALALPAGE